MIKRLQVKKLNQRHDLDLKFYPDLNLFTGKNGCGKTTILKLIWYLTSGNLTQLFSAISFGWVHFESDNVSADLEITTEDSLSYVSGYYSAYGMKREYVKVLLDESETNSFPIRAKEMDKSIFFPTFRRIEGGFSIDNPKDDYVIHEGNRIRIGRGDDLNSAFNELSRRISPNKNNRFIASISTQDIIKLLNEKYTEILEKIRGLENEQSEIILNKIKGRKQDSGVLAEIEELVEETDSKKSDLLKPFNILSHLIQEIFMDKSIQITRTLTLGEAKDAIISDKLSAGEKQMLSFLCYNFFSDDTSIFIDEPELSLHTDWQRILFPTLLEQATNNQFFVATHSPFIYSKYSDREHIIDLDKGGKLV